MKKIVIATLLVMSATVAQAQVTVSGKVSEWVGRTKVGSVTTTAVNPDPTSNIKFAASESLGSGLTARAIVETSLGSNSINGNGTQLGDSQGTVGIANAFGSVDLGRNVHSQFLAVSNNDAFGTLYGSVAGNVHNLRGQRLGNAAFITVTPMKGVTVEYDRAATGLAGAEASSYSASGSFSGVNGTVARFVQGAETSTVIGGNTKFNNTQVFFSHSEDKGAVVSKGNLIGVKQQVGAFGVKASYGTTNAQVKAYALGVDYAFSRRTEVGVAYRNVNLAGVANDTTEIGVGITHRF